MKLKTLVVGLSLVITSNTAFALESWVGTVILIEPTYLPSSIAFQMDSGNTTCPAGKWLQWSNPDQANNKAVYATLLTAFTTGKKVRFHINDGDTTCTGQYFHILN